MLPEVVAVVSLLASLVSAQSSTLPAPGQPLQTGSVGQFEIIGETLVSAQQVSFLILDPISRVFLTFANVKLFLGRPDKVFIVDKVEANPAQIDGHPAWASGELSARLRCNGC